MKYTFHFIVGLFVLILLQTFYSELFGVVIADERAMASYLKKQEKYVNGSMELISFDSKNSSEGHEQIRRTGFLVKRSNARGTVLMCHGFMCSKYDTSFLRMLFPEYHVMIFDFRAHGEHITERQCCTFGRDEAYDVIAAADYLKSRKDLDVNRQPFIAYGFSMGAVASIQAQAMRPDLFDLMILDCPYDCSEKLLKRCCKHLTFSFFGKEFSVPGRSILERYAFNPVVQSILKTLLKTVAKMDATATNTYIYPCKPADSIKSVNIPCLFIHCVNDEKVTVDAAQNIFNNAGGYKRLWLTAGRWHFDSFFYNPEKYAYKANRFIEDVISEDYKKKKRAHVTQDVIVAL